jgi:AAA domain
MHGLVIGGSSCVGKTTVAAQLCAEANAIHLGTDRALPRTAAFRPLDGSPDIWDRPPQQLCHLLVAAAEAALPLLLQVISEHASAEAAWVLEGERVHPMLVARARRASLADGLLIVETSTQRLRETLLARLPRFHELLPSRQEAVVEVNRRYNLWLQGEAAVLGLTCIPSQPWTTLAKRVQDWGARSAGQGLRPEDLPR